MTRTRIVGGSLWMIAMRWTMRLIGLISTIILARLLTPEDFGLVAMATIVVGLFEILGDTGVDLALLRDRNATREHYDTAWTIQVMQGVAVAAILMLAIEPAARYFDEPRARAAIAVLALRPLIDGLRNIGIVAFRKELDFAREFRFQVVHKLAGFVIVVSLALVWRSYWALIIGGLAAGVIGVVISYGMHPYRPRFTLSRVRDIWSFSQWLLVSRMGIFGNRQADKFAVGGTAGTDSMGGYHIAKEIGSMLSNELIFPIRRALFPNFAILVAERQRLEQAVVALLSVVATLVVAVQFGLAAIAPDFVVVILGERWVHITVLIPILAFAGAASGIIMALEFLLPVTNRTGVAAVAAWLELLALVAALVYAVQGGTLIAVASARLWVAVAFVPIMIGLVAHTCQVRPVAMLAVLWRPLVAGGAMLLVLHAAHPHLYSEPLWRLPAKIALGAVTYCGAIVVLWLLAGRPPGMERQLWQRL